MAGKVGSLKISAWNINGYKSVNLGNKLQDIDFLREIKEDDIVGLSETHINDGVLDKLCIPGFKRISFRNRPLKKKSKKSYGGIAVFAKESISNMVISQKNNCQNSLWVKLKKEKTGEREDIFLGTIYMSPPKHKNKDVEDFNEIFEEIMYFKNKGRVIIQGDINAHTSNERDFIKTGNFFDINDETDIQNWETRNSEDKILVDHRGNALLELCKTLNLLILNGRKTGDLFGKITSFQSNGNSVVDYVLTEHELFEKIAWLKVGKYLPWISDHCAVHFQIDLQNYRGPQKNLTTKNVTDKYEPFVWGEENCKKIKKSLEDNVQMINNVYEIDESCPKDLLSGLVESMQKIATAAGIKKKRAKHKTDKHHSWYDKECRTMKTQIKKLGNTIRRDPHKAELRTKVFMEKNSSRTL